MWGDWGDESGSRGGAGVKGVSGTVISYGKQAFLRTLGMEELGQALGGLTWCLVASQQDGFAGYIRTGTLQGLGRS